MKDRGEARRAPIWTGWIPLLAIAGACLLAYANSLKGVFVFDDLPAILDNPSIRHLWPVGPVLAPANFGATVDGRPILNLSLALNRAAGGTDPAGYHLFNLGVHLLAALALFGLVRRLGYEPEYAFAAALIWAVHPLNTEAVTYVVQRAESLMGLFYLLTIYGFVRSMESERSAAWKALSVACCLLGMGTKEVMASAPLAVALLDRAFFAGSIREAWRQRRGYYLCLAGTWLVLAAGAWHAGNRGATSGFGSGISVWRYWAVQPAAIVRYLRLSFWPHPLLFDYGTGWMEHPAGGVLGPGLLVAALGLATVWGLAGNRRWAVAAFCFFAVLAPTSLVPGNRQTLAEHRMYLALIPVLLLALAGLRRLGASWRIVLGISLALAAAAVAATHLRNRAYYSPLALYGDAVAQMPDNPYAQANLGTALMYAGRYAEAREHLEAARRLKPDSANIEDNVGNVFFYLGRYPEAEPHYLRAIALDPKFAEPHENLAGVLLREERFADAEREARAALRIKPGLPGAHDNLGLALLRQGRNAEALEEFRAALRLNPALGRTRRIIEGLEAARPPG